MHACMGVGTIVHKSLPGPKFLVHGKTLAIRDDSTPKTSRRNKWNVIASELVPHFSLVVSSELINTRPHSIYLYVSWHVHDLMLDVYTIQKKIACSVHFTDIWMCRLDYTKWLPKVGIVTPFQATGEFCLMYAARGILNGNVYDR